MSNNNKRARVLEEECIVLEEEYDRAHQPDAVASREGNNRNITTHPGAEIEGASSSILNHTTTTTTTTTYHQHNNNNNNVELVYPLSWEVIPELIYVKMMLTETDDPEEIADAFQKLGNLLHGESQESIRNTKEAFALGAHTVIIGNLRNLKYQYDESVQRTGCRCLRSLALPEANRAAIVKAGGMEVVVNALKLFPNNLLIQWSGLGCITNLFLPTLEDNALKNASKRFVNDLGGLEIAVAAMKAFPDESYMVKYCCGLFACLAQDRELHGPMRAVGVVSAVGIAYEKFFDDAGVKECASCFMKQIIDR